MELSVVLPIHNEELNLYNSVEEYAKQIVAIIGDLTWQYVLVENGSTDRSPEIIKEIKGERPETITLSLPKGDYGNALREGVLHAEGKWILIMNVDHLWDDPYFIWAWNYRNEYDMIIGSKRADPTLNRQDNYRRILSSGLNSLLMYLFDSVVAESHGMKLLKAETIKPLSENCVMRRGQFDTELTLRALRKCLWVSEIPMPYEEKRAPRNFMIKKIAQNLWDICRLNLVMKSVPFNGLLRYRRYCREDIIKMV